MSGSTSIPGGKYWTADAEWPVGDFGFVWGCYWGDDSPWKVQYLDLSRVQQGIIARDDRFGYVELATDGFCSPCVDPEPPQKTYVTTLHPRLEIPGGREGYLHDQNGIGSCIWRR